MSPTTAMLAMVHDATGEELHASLVEARRQELVDFLEGSYRFVHDRVHEAAYALIPTERRAAVHLRIGRILVAHTPPGKLDEAIFEIVNQLNRASSSDDGAAKSASSWPNSICLPASAPKLRPPMCPH